MATKCSVSGPVWCWGADVDESWLGLRTEIRKFFWYLRKVSYESQRPSASKTNDFTRFKKNIVSSNFSEVPISVKISHFSRVNQSIDDEVKKFFITLRKLTIEKLPKNCWKCASSSTLLMQMRFITRFCLFPAWKSINPYKFLPWICENELSSLYK